MAELIGTGRCPVGCGSAKARYTLSAKKLAVGTCNACNCQVFARSDRSDELLRANIVATGAPAPAPEPSTAPALAAPKADPQPQADPPAPPERTFGWGLLKGRAY